MAVRAKTETTEIATKETPVITKSKAKKIDIHSLVKVRNGFMGKLVYVSPKTGYTFILEDYGEEDYIEVGELLNARNAYKSFFENNWFLIEDEDVIKFLNLEKYYTNTIKIDEMETLFDLPIDEMVQKIQNAPKGQRDILTYKAIQTIQSGRIDSRSRISAIVNTLGIQSDVDKI